MPHLRSQQDYANWTTPYLTDIFNGDNSIELSDTQLGEIQHTIENALSTVSTDARVTQHRSMPNYAQFQIDFGESLDNNSCQQLLNSLSEKTDWVMGFLPHKQSNKSYDVLIRTKNHVPMTVHQVLLRPPYRKAESIRSLVLGVTLEQQIIIHNLETLQNLIIAGDRDTTQNIVRSFLATLLLTNTPSQLRLALIGTNRSTYPNVTDTPHMLGEFVTNPFQGIRLLSGIAREIRRRQAYIKKTDCNSILDYNTEYPQAILPHVLLVIDSLDTIAWKSQQSKWLSNLTHILRDGAAVGIHLFIVTPDITNELLHPLYAAIQTKIITRSIATDYARQIDNFDDSVWQFVDAVVIEEGDITPVEMPLVTASDTQAIAAYWRKNAEERMQTTHLKSMSQKSGITSLFQKLQKDNTAPAPPVPQTPPAQVLAYAASVLSHIGENNETETQTMHTETEATTTATQLEEAKTISTQITGVADEISIQMDSIRRAHALASYLGWLGRGPLMDILGLTLQEAELIIAILQARQILERSDTPTPRLRSSSQTN